MATPQSDIRFVRIHVSIDELQVLIGDKAQTLGFIDFAPDRMQLFQNGTDAQGAAVYEIVFEKDT